MECEPEITMLGLFGSYYNVELPAIYADLPTQIFSEDREGLKIKNNVTLRINSLFC